MTPEGTPAAHANVDKQTVAGFGDEWSRFDQKALDDAELQQLFDAYFHLFPWSELPSHATGFDFGCGSGRWARLVCPRVGQLVAIDASPAAAAVARGTLASERNCAVVIANADTIPLADDSADFAYSLGVLHHIPDTAAAMRACVRKLRRGAPFLVYLYYRFDNRPLWYRLLWALTDPVRRIVSRMPHVMRYAVSQVIAALVYWPVSRLASIAERLAIRVDSFPLAYYRSRSFYVMRTDALDRFGTHLEQRFTRAEVDAMMRASGLDRIEFSQRAPFWCAVGRRAR